jgi:hypothetical protein
LASRFTGLPDVHYGDATHLVSGDIGVTKWTITGTTPTGTRIQALGCDFYTFRDDLNIGKEDRLRCSARGRGRFIRPSLYGRATDDLHLARRTTNRG